ncbi:DUF547 domain-containing protein [Lacinutrix sp. C3R15]|uniref:DUF547 domain-containing protein n=1 Tax=Flavobacteriaceae TaxID=49546 RepID=UPI001C0A0A33|nr:MULTISPECIES: DUF547 domain-containing protein [Flavobacteriaceae]MBU2939148.1 DUF547 domain-containing protein [Lacinutrix sp. C3R15]MDO6622464.1 DUF547 domain-containing protein [Oceanihabitans sp. 1_MG-2023]
MKHFSLILFTILVTTSCVFAKQVTPGNQIKKTETTTVKPQEVLTKNKIPEAFNHDAWNTLLQKNVSKTGHVNYIAFKNNPTELHAYITSLGKNMPTKTWTKKDKLAYWINAYNALTVDLIIKNYPVKSIKDIKDPWDQKLWKLGEKWYNLNEIEHEILRKMNEPRIHFAIVCASFSCPKLQNQAFTATKLEEQLTAATKAFLADKNRNEIASDSIKISKIFQWFSKDFKQNGSLIDFLNTYAEVQISSNAKKSYKDYNWSLNE